MTKANGASGRWPDVTSEPRDHAYIDRHESDGRCLRAPKTVVANGYVEGIPWSMTAFESKGGAGCVYGPGRFVEFFLGGSRWRPGGFGGGGDAAALADDEPHDLELSGLLFEALPGIVVHYGCTSERTHHLEVHLEGGDSRRVDLMAGPAGFLPLFIFFPPPRAHGRVFAIAAGMRELQWAELFPWSELPPGASNAGIAGMQHGPAAPPA